MSPTLTVRVSDSAGNETFQIHTFGVASSNVYTIDALTAPWSNQAAGSTADQTASIKAQIAAIPDGVAGMPNVIRFPVGKSQGKYFTQGDLANSSRGINGAVLFRNRRHLIIEGPSAADPATFYTVSPAVPYGAQINLNQQSERRHFWFQGCTDITVRNLRVEGSNYKFATQLANGNPVFWLGGPDTGGTGKTRGYRAPWEAEHGFGFDGCNGVVFEDCQVQDVWGDGFYLGSYGGSGTNNFAGRRLSLIGTGRQGWAMSRCADVLIEDFTIGSLTIHPRRAGMDLEPVVNWVVERVEIRNFVIWMGHMTAIAALGQSRVDDINIHDGVVNEGPGGKCQVGASDNVRRKNWRIANVNFKSYFGSPAPAMTFKKVDGVLLENNIIRVAGSDSRRVVSFTDCDGDLILRDNDMKDGCWIDYDAASSIPQLQGGNIFGGGCPNPLRLV